MGGTTRVQIVQVEPTWLCFTDAWKGAIEQFWVSAQQEPEYLYLLLLEDVNRGLSRELCNFFSHRYSLTEQNHKLIECRLPVANRPCPPFCHLLEPQVQHFHNRLIRGERPTGFEPLA